MGFRFFSLCENPPEGFKGTRPSLDDFKSSTVVLHASSLNEAFAFLEDQAPEIQSIAVTTGESFHSELTSHGTWHLRFPTECRNIPDLVESFISSPDSVVISGTDGAQAIQDRLFASLSRSCDFAAVEEQLRESHLELRQTQILANIGSWKWDLKNDILEISQGMMLILGIPSSTDYSSFRDIEKDFLHPDDIKTFREVIYDLAQGKITDPHTFRLISPSGEIRWINFSRPQQGRLSEDGRPEEIMGVIQDITDQKKADEELRSSELKLTNAARNIPGVIFQLFIRKSGEYGIDFVSGNLQRVFGIPENATDLFDHLIEGIPTEEGRDSFYASMNEAVSSESNWDFETPFRKPSGEEMQLRIISRPTLLSDVLLFNGVLLDVTAQRKAIARTEHLNSLLLAISNTNQLIVQEADMEVLLQKACETLVETRSYLECIVALIPPGTQAVEKIFQAGVVNHPKDDLMIRELPSCAREVLKEGRHIVREKADDCQGCTSLGKHGEGFFPTAVAPMRSEGDVSGLLFVTLSRGTIIDDEELNLLQEVADDLAYAMRKHKAEEELKRTEKRYRMLFDSSHDAIMTLAPPSWKFTSGNPSILEMFNVSSEEEFITMGPWELSPELQPDDRLSSEKAKEMIQKAMDEGSNFFEWTHQKLDGSSFPATVLLTRIEMQDATFLQATVRDITERKEMEEAIRKSEAQIRDVANSVPGVIFQFYVQPGGKNGLHYVSERSTAVLGIESDPRYFLKHFLKCLPRAERKPLIGSILQAVSQKIDWKHTTRFQKPDGEQIWLRGLAIPTEHKEEIHFNGVFLDVTEQMQAEEALRNERDYSDSIIKGTPAIICGISPDGITKYVNPAGEKVTGYSSEYLVGRDWWRTFYPGEEYRQVEELMEEFREKGDVKDYEMSLLDRNGERKVISWSSINRKNEEGEVIEVIGFGHDVTHRRKAEEELLQSERLFRSVVENNPAGIFLVDSNYKLVYSNEQLCRMSGYSIDEIIGMDFRDVLDEESMNTVVDRYRARQQGLDVENNYELVVMRKDGERRNTMLYVDHILDSQGNPRTLGEIIDITDRKKTEIELNQLRNYLVSIIDSMPSVLIGISCDMDITLWNKKAEELIGSSSNQVIGQKLTTVIPAIQNHLKTISDSISSRMVKYRGKQSSLLNGQNRFEDITVYPLVADGIEGAVIRIDDVTEQVHLEEMMIQSEKMLSVGGLAAGMAHEINNPLAGMMQNAEVILRRLTTDLPENHRIARDAGTTMEAITQFLEKRSVLHQLELIHDSGKRAALIVQNMLSFARKSEGRRTLCSIADLLDRTVELAENDYDLKKKHDFRHVDIFRDYDSQLPRIYCEKSKLQQVFLNILRNGTEAMSNSRSKSGSPEKPRFIFRTSRRDGMACVEIEDNGPGIPPDVRKRVFEPFFTTKEVGVGTGLGLSVSYFIITEDHKGTMSVESVPGVATSFIIELPIEEEDRDDG